MDTLDNPQTFQNSSIVQKSSTTGIFSNKRLLVIKQGYLYYFSKVPKTYKLHIANILSSFTQLPKSSIQIKTILQIRLQSSKSSNLIIKFYQKDMIKKQDIRKSIDSQLYNPIDKKKNKNETDEWKFTFTTVLQCRLWYNALLKLKEYYKKQENHFKQFINNFNFNLNANKKNIQATINNSKDKDKRSQSTIININNNNMVSPINNGHTNSNIQQQRKTQNIKFNASKFMATRIQQQSSQQSSLVQSKLINSNSFIKKNSSQKDLNKNNNSSNADKQLKPAISKKKQKQQQQYIQQNQHQNNSPPLSYVLSSPNNHHPLPSSLHPQQPSTQFLHPISKIQQLKHSSLKQSQLIQPINQDQQIKIKQIQDQIRQQLQQQLRKQFNKQKQQTINKYKEQMNKKQRIIKQLEGEIFKNHIINQQKMKEIEENKILLENKIKIEQEKLLQYKLSTSIQKDTQKQHKQQNIQNISQNKQYHQLKYHQSPQSYQHIHKEQQNKNKTNTNTNKIYINMTQFSVQTDQQDFQYNQDHEVSELNLSKQLKNIQKGQKQKQKRINNSNLLNENINSKKTIQPNHKKQQKIVKNIPLQTTKSFTQQDQQRFSCYNYFLQQSLLFEPGISSSQRINRQVTFLSYINYLQQKSLSILTQFLSSTPPLQHLTYTSDIFTFSIFFTPGKILSIGGQNKLIYSNKLHQKLKRQFKIYQKLQNQILKQLKKKNKFQLRAPLCFLVQYKGYTILVKIQPEIYQDKILNKEKYLKHVIQAEYHENLQLNKIYSVQYNTHTYNNHKNKEYQYLSTTQLILIKVINTFKITDNNKKSNLFKDINNIYDIKKHIQTCRCENVSVQYEKLQKQLSQQKQENKINNSKILQYIKFFRELKKIQKSIDPFSDQSYKQKSQFLQSFLQRPQQIISLIPSNNNFININIHSGYFYYLLDFFLGIRVNTKLSQPINIKKLSYSFNPIVRKYQFNQLISSQFNKKVQKSLQICNIQTAQNAYKVIQKFNNNIIQSKFIEIRILLKKRSYMQAQQQILHLKQLIPIHSILHIDLNTFLIQCKIFNNNFTQALKQIKQSLQYLQYMFKNQNNNIYQSNLYLLMAQTLLKIGNTNEAIKIYKMLIRQGKIQKENILLSFGQILQFKQSFDLNQSINFLMDLEGQVTKIANKIEVNKYLANIYKKIKRNDKVKYHAEIAFQICIKNNVTDKALDVYELILELTQKQSDKNIRYNKFLDKMSNSLFYNQKNCMHFNTVNLLNIIKTFKQIQIQVILNKLSSLQEKIKINNIIQLKKWQQLSQFAHKLIFTQQANFQNLLINSEILQFVNIKSIIDELRSEKQNN